jgi:hypothetical protein
MARRIEIELTSDRGDGTWTWRAAGARQPKGTLDAALLPSPASVGDVLRAEVEGFLDGLTIVAVLPPKAARAEPEKLELLSRRSEGPLVTTRVARTPRAERRDGRDRRPPREGRDHRDGRDNSDGRDGREGRDRRTAPRPAAKVEAKPRPKRLRPGKAHRNALLESLPPEQRPIAEQLFQGGIPAVRQAIEKQNEELKAEGKSQVSPEPLLEVAEKLRHRAQTALWRDRADAALASIDDLDLRDLRSVVNAAGDAGRDAEARTVAEQLREALANRVEKEQAAWVDEVAENLREGRVVRALRLSSRPPKAGSPLPPDPGHRGLADRRDRPPALGHGARRAGLLADPAAGRSPLAADQGGPRPAHHDRPVRRAAARDRPHLRHRARGRPGPRAHPHPPPAPQEGRGEEREA